jgi:hypothetical protein
MKFMNYQSEESGGVVFCIYGEEVFKAKDVAIVYDNISGTLLKHGPKENVVAWRERAVERYCGAGYYEQASDLVMFSGSFDPEDLNRMIEVDGYVKSFHQRMEEDKEPGRDW